MFMMMTVMKSGACISSSRSLGSFRISKKEKKEEEKVEEDDEPSVAVVEEQTDVPHVGSIEVVIPEQPTASSTADNGNLLSPLLPSFARRCVQIVCRPPDDTSDNTSDRDLDPEAEEELDDDELVRFLVESINDLVERHHEEEKECEDENVATSMMDALTFACLNTCGNTVASSFPFTSSSSSASKATKGKSILRTRGADSTCRSPTEAGILSDRTVSFSQLEIHEFDMTLGDHPSAVSGPPVALDYNSNATKVIDVEEYERVRTPRRTRKHLKLSYHDKCQTLQNRGFSLQEVHDAWAEAIRIRKQRQETVRQSYYSMLMDDVWESTCRKYQRAMESIAVV